MNRPKALYVHIPFCSRICSYCDFPKYLVRTDLVEDYLSALKEELSEIPAQNLDTVYIGGGTPSVLSPEQLDSLTSFLCARFRPSLEFSVEGNPESLTEEKARILAKNGVTRISLGAQSFDKNILRLLNREEDTEDEVVRAVEALHQAGIREVNLDFIYGLKDEKKEEISRQIQVGSKLGLTHFSFYSIQIEENTPLYYKKDAASGEDEAADMYAFIVSELERYGYERYEVSNFAKPGHESLHNLTYWRNQGYYACGLGATSYVDNVRSTRTRNIRKYADPSTRIAESRHEDSAEREFDYLMLGLRLKEGISLEDFKQQFGKDFLESYRNELANLKNDFETVNGRFKVRNDKLYILDSLLVDLLHFRDA